MHDQDQRTNAVPDAYEIEALMTSHVEQQIAARIAAVRARRQQQYEGRAEFAHARAAGLKARKTTKLRRIFCGTCARMQRKGSYLRCPLGCGDALCRSNPRCGNTHLRQCSNRGDAPTVAGPVTTADGLAGLHGAEDHAGMGQSPTVEEDSVSPANGEAS